MDKRSKIHNVERTCSRKFIMLNGRWVVLSRKTFGRLKKRSESTFRKLSKAIFSFRQGSAFGKETALGKPLQIGEVGTPDNEKSASNLKVSEVKQHH